MSDPASKLQHILLGAGLGVVAGAWVAVRLRDSAVREEETKARLLQEELRRERRAKEDAEARALQEERRRREEKVRVLREELLQRELQVIFNSRKACKLVKPCNCRCASWRSNTKCANGR